jgi:hypothetical protein
MPKLLHMERVTPNLTLGVQKVASEAGAGVWTSRIRFTGMSGYRFKSTKIPFDPSDKHNKMDAQTIALQHLREAEDDHAKGIASPGISLTLQSIATKYLDRVYEQGEANDDRIRQGKNPIHAVDGGRGYWSIDRFRKIQPIFLNHLFPFIKSLKSPNISQITNRELDGLDEFMLNQNPDVSPSQRLKSITEIRHVYRFAKSKGWVDTIPIIKRPKPQTKERKRPRITEEMYLEMVRVTRSWYMDEKANPEYRDYHYLFHLWILILANTGIRPPTGNYDHTRIRWRDLDITTREDGKTIATLARPSEKSHTYEAIVMPRSIRYWDALKTFQKQHGIYDAENGYVFAHPRDRIDKNGNVSWLAGYPIKTFRGSWKRLQRDMGITPAKGAPQSQRIVPYSLRHYFITQRLVSDDNVRIEELAFATGTSVQMIMDIYYDLDIKKRYDSLTHGGFKDEHKAEPKYNDNGYYIGTK